MKLKSAAFILSLFCIGLCSSCDEPVKKPAFKVIAFYNAETEQAHLSFIHEANRWFSKMASLNNFSYDSTTNWDNLSKPFLEKYQVVIFLDNRPDSLSQRNAFREYMEKGGAWMGFHFAAFALTPSDFNQDWDWYHNEFLGSGQYVSNTWRPTTAILRIENHDYPFTRNIADTFTASANEWYRWEKDLRKNPDIKILASIDSSSFPLGTGPKLHEIWHSGYYPVIWTNKKYRMLYLNMGHNDIDYENKTNKELSFTFNNPVQDKMILDALIWLGKKK